MSWWTAQLTCLALKYVVENAAALNVDPARLAIGGTSSGGNLAACVAQRAGQATPPIPIQFAVLGVPVCDNTATAATHKSWGDLANAPGLPAPKMMWCTCD